MESRKRIQLSPSDAKTDLFTAIPREELLTTLFHYGTEVSAVCKRSRARPGGKNPSRPAMKKGPVGPFYCFVDRQCLVAAAATAVATTVAATTATAAAEAAGTRGTRFHRTGFIDVQAAAADLLAVHAFDGS